MNLLRLLKESLFKRRIQVDIVTIFISLIIIFFLIITTFSYTRYREDILNLSKEIMQWVENNVISQIRNIKSQSESLAKSTRSLSLSEEAISLKNSDLIAYLFNALQFSDIAYSIAIETLNGNLLSAFNLAITPEPITKSIAPLPMGGKYAIRYIDRSTSTPTETWVIKDTDLKTIQTKSVSPVVFDLRMEKWYKDTVNWPHVRWSNLYDPGEGTIGLIVSAPVISDEMKVIGALAIRLSLDQLSNAVSFLQIGKSGKVFILDQNGNLLIPNIQPSKAVVSQIPFSLITSIYENYQKTHENYSILRVQNIDYATSVIDFPVSYENHWSIVIIVPQTEFIGHLMRTQIGTFILSIIMLVLFSLLVYFSSKHISNPIVQLSHQVDRIQHFDFNETPRLSTHILEIMQLDSSIAAMRTALRSFGRYVPKEIVQTLLAQQQKEIVLGGEKRDLTIMFSDITDFTQYSEQFSLEKLMPALSEYFDRLSQIIIQSEGTIDKFIGDGILAFWGAPQYVSEQSHKACLASLHCLIASNNEIKNEGMPPWRTRFGIHSGEVIVGNIGTYERMNYTIIGDAANVASRLEALNKVYHTSIIISDNIKDKVWKHFITRPLDFLAVKGKKNRLMIHELVGTSDENSPTSASAEQIELCQLFTDAYSTFLEGDLESAKNQFLTIKQRFADDFPTQLYLERISAKWNPKS